MGRPKGEKSPRALLAAGGLGAVVAYFLDPRSGSARRRAAAARARGLTGRPGGEATVSGGGAGGPAAGPLAPERAEAPGSSGPPPSAAPSAGPTPAPGHDESLAREVESLIFESEDAPRGTVAVDARDGIVYLRGQCERPDQIEELVSVARSVAGVRGVEHRLHAPPAPPPAPPTQRRGGRFSREPRSE